MRKEISHTGKEYSNELGLKSATAVKKFLKEVYERSIDGNLSPAKHLDNLNHILSIRKEIQNLPNGSSKEEIMNLVKKISKTVGKEETKEIHTQTNEGDADNKQQQQESSMPELNQDNKINEKEQNVTSNEDDLYETVLEEISNDFLKQIPKPAKQVENKPMPASKKRKGVITTPTKLQPGSQIRTDFYQASKRRRGENMYKKLLAKPKDVSAPKPSIESKPAPASKPKVDSQAKVLHPRVRRPIITSTPKVLHSRIYKPETDLKSAIKNIEKWIVNDAKFRKKSPENKDLSMKVRKAIKSLNPETPVRSTEGGEKNLEDIPITPITPIRKKEKKRKPQEVNRSPVLTRQAIIRARQLRRLVDASKANKKKKEDTNRSEEN